MKKKKLSLEGLKVNSFVTTVAKDKIETIKGGVTDPQFCLETHDCPTCPGDCTDPNTTPHNGCGDNDASSECILPSSNAFNGGCPVRDVRTNIFVC